MTGVLELGGVAAMAFTATTSLGIAGYGHANKCLNGYLRRGRPSRTRKNSHPRRLAVAPPDGILTLDGVLCSMNSLEPCRGRVEFNGEVLFAALNEEGMMKPITALCNSDVAIDGCKVTTSPLQQLPTLELTFECERDAREWGNAFKEASKVCEPHQRIHELVAHIVDMEKHIKDLRGRAARVAEYEKTVNDLRKALGMMKLEKEGVHTDLARRVLCNEPDLPQLQSIGEDTRRSYWFSSSTVPKDTVPKGRYEEAVKLAEQNQEELAKHLEQLQRHQAQNEELREKLSQHVHPDEHERLQEEMRYHREECKKANEEIVLLRRRIEEAVPLIDEAVAQTNARPSSCDDTSNLNTIFELQGVVQDVEDRCAHLKNHLASVERSYEEERLRANSATSKAETLTQEKEVLMTQIEELKNAGRSMLEAMNAEKNARDEETTVAQNRHHISVEQLQRQIDDMQTNFRNQMQAAQDECTRKLEERQRQYEAQMKELQDELQKKHSFRDDINGSQLDRNPDDILKIADTELTAKVGILAQENCHLKTQLSQKAQRLELDSLALQGEAERPLARPSSPLRQQGGASNYTTAEVKTLLNSTPRTAFATNVATQAIGTPTSPTCASTETSPLQRVIPRASTPGLSVRLSSSPSTTPSTYPSAVTSSGPNVIKKSCISKAVATQSSPKQSSPRTVLSMDSRGPGLTFPATSSLPVSRASVPIHSTTRPTPTSWRTTSLS